MTLTTTTSRPSPTPKSSIILQSLKLFFLFFAFFIITTFLYQIRSFRPSFTFLSTLPIPASSSIEPTHLVSELRDSVTFLPIKDTRVVEYPGNTWFMSSVNDTLVPNQPKHIYFPSANSNNRLLCLLADNNLYALAFHEALPTNSTLLKGLTFVSDTFYIYKNIYHGLGAVMPFVAWHEANRCARPERWVLFQRGALRAEMGNWLHTLASAAIGNQVSIEGFDGYRPVCFEKAVVCRHNEEGLKVERKREVIDMIRCKVREHCGVVRKAEDSKTIIRLTLLFRVGARAFKNETAVIEIFDAECRKVDGCELKVAVSNNLTFCDQVKLMTETDILVTSHGAQLTNMIFMDRNSSIMEFFPKGWLEFAGVGQYVYEWLAASSGMKHQGQWKEPNNEKCPHSNGLDCFSLYKDGSIGYDKVYFANWTATILQKVKEYKLSQTFLSSIQEQARFHPCPCN